MKVHLWHHDETVTTLEGVDEVVRDKYGWVIAVKMKGVVVPLEDEWVMIEIDKEESDEGSEGAG